MKDNQEIIEELAENVVEGKMGLTEAILKLPTLPEGFSVCADDTIEIPKKKE